MESHLNVVHVINSKNEIYFKMHIDKEHEIPFGCCAYEKIPKTKYILKCTLIKSIKSHLDVVHVIKFQKRKIF